MTLSKLDFLFLENITGLRAVDIFLASIYAPCLGKLSQYLKSWVIVHLKKNTKISHKSGHFQAKSTLFCIANIDTPQPISCHQVQARQASRREPHAQAVGAPRFYQREMFLSDNINSLFHIASNQQIMNCAAPPSSPSTLGTLGKLAVAAYIVIICTMEPKTP